MGKSKSNPAEYVIERGADHRRAMLKIIGELSSRHGTWRVFEDWVALSAISISNAVDLVHYDEREKDYMSIIERYNKPEIEQFPKLFAELMCEAQEQDLYPQDILGPLFHELELHNKYRGQFFTPQNVCDMMAKMIFSSRDSDIERKGYIGISEPCCGSGAMILGMASAIHEAGYNYQQHCWVEARDIDLKCVHMCYVQLALHGIPAVVIHGNAITMEEYSRWYTPQFILGGWSKMLEFERQVKAVSDLMNPLFEVSREQNPTPNSTTAITSETIKYAESKWGQLTLF